MTQRERITEEHRDNVHVYETDQNAQVYDRNVAPVRTHDDHQHDYDNTVYTPTDRVRWGPIIAGLFAALATLAALTVLGLAIGAATFDPNDQASSYGIGAGIWAAISALIAFFVGGWLAARTSALPGRSSGILNGAMVWFVAIPLLLFGIGSGVSAIGRGLANVAGTAAQVGAAGAAAAGDEAAAAAQDPNVQQQAGDAAGAVQQQAQELQQQAQNPQTQQQVADTVSANAWRVLLSLGIAAAAAIAGGAAGARRDDRDTAPAVHA